MCARGALHAIEHTDTRTNEAMVTGYDVRGAQTRFLSYEVANIGSRVVQCCFPLCTDVYSLLTAVNRNEMENFFFWFDKTEGNE